MKKPWKREAPGPGESVPPRRPNPQKEARWRIASAWLLAGLLLLLLFQGSLFSPRRQEIPVSRFLELVEQGRVKEAHISAEQVDGVFTSDGTETRFTTSLPLNYEPNELVDTLSAKGVEVTASGRNLLTDLLVNLLPFVLLGALYYFFFFRRIRQQVGGPMSFGKNKAKLFDRRDMKTTFNDVAGVDEVEAELAELVDYLKNSQKYQRIGARIPKGVLLVGPPGTGKTLLARAVAGEANVPFYYVSASEFIELFVGLGAARVRDLFQQARERAPAIVFVDEIDSVGQTRSGAGAFPAASHQEQEQTLQQLLTEMDGFEPNSGVIIMAASNRPEVLDPALLRPGRFDRQIQVNLPDIKGREQILEIHARKAQLAEDVDLQVLARRTPGFSGAQLANVINEGALLAARRGKPQVEMEDLEEAVDRVVAGLERRSQVLTDREKRLIAYHELGHALVARFVDHADPVHRVSIIPRGIGALGYTQQLPDEERYLMSEPELRDRIAVLLGGRAAEEIVFGFATTGAHDDLKKATEIARRMVMEFGMSAQVGPINIAENGYRFLSPAFRRGEDVSEETETAIDREVKAILLDAQSTARSILTERRRDLDALAELLLEKETLDRRALDEYFGAETVAAGAPASDGFPQDQPRPAPGAV